MHIEYEFMPEKLDEEKFILYFRKYHQLMRDEMTSALS